MRVLLVATPMLMLSTPAMARWPEDVTLSAMLDHNGQRITAPVSDDYRQLITELGTAISNKPISPAGTLGAFGFDFSLQNAFVFTSARGTPTDPSPWERAAPDEDPSPWMFVPTFTARKGFAASFEFGTTAGWVGMHRQGVFGAFGRLGVIEGYKPYPDLTVQMGYSGYIGNVELDMGVLDFSVRLGQNYAFGAFPEINTAQFEPYLDYSLLRITAAPRLDPAVAQAIGATRYYSFGQADDAEPAIGVHRFAAGFQVTNGTVHFRAAGMYAVGSVPSVTVGMGFTY